MMKLKENSYIIYLWDEEEETLVTMHAVETHLRKLYIRILRAINEGLKLVNIYRVNSTIKIWSKSHFKQSVEKDMIKLKMTDMLDARDNGKRIRLDEYLILKLEQRIKAGPLDSAH